MLSTAIDTTHYHLLWFRPLSPLNYGLPTALAAHTWASTPHIPLDVLTPCQHSEFELHHLRKTDVWLLSSPTAAHLAAHWGKPRIIAAMGLPTQAAWRAAGGNEPEQWLISPTGESMGLFKSLKHHPYLNVLRSRTGRNDLLTALRSTGVIINTLAVYEKHKHPTFEWHLNSTLNHFLPSQSAGLSPPIMLCFTSADQPARILAACQSPELLLRCRIWVSHDRIAHAAQILGLGK